MNTLEELTAQITWLTELPDTILQDLYLDEFHIPDTATIEEIRDMEEGLDCYIMPYALDIFRQDLPPEQHLCANIGTAALSTSRLEAFLNFEANLTGRGISLAAYEKPLRIIMPARL